MGLFNFGTLSSPASAEYEDIVAFYQRLRPIRMRLNNELVHTLSRSVLDEGAKKLGLLRNGTFVFETEDESSVLMDYCISDVYRDGRNAIERYLCDSPPDPESDEMAYLQAMQHSTYALVVVLGTEPGVGCHIRNLYTDETQLLVDIGFSHSAERGLVLATRLLDFGGFVTTSGAALPATVLEGEALEEWQGKISRGVRGDKDDPAEIIRNCLERGASSHVRYEEGSNSLRFDRREGFSSTRNSTKKKRGREKVYTGKPLENRRCKCGSGKMVKNCCGKNKSPS